MKFKIILILITIFALNLVSATVTLEVTGFSCSPNEVGITDQFTCTATIFNSGDATAELDEVTLYPDSSNWLEYSSYAEVVNTNINSGTTTEVVFESLRAQKSGTFGFARISLDEAVDNYPADNNVEVNVIDIVTIVIQSANSAVASTGTVDVTGQVNVGGDLDLNMIISIVSGGCSIGSQSSSAAFNDLTDGQTVSYTWTITMGTRNCGYRVTSDATSNPLGVALKSDFTSKTITCTGTTCTSTTDTTTSTSASAGGGGGSYSNKTKDQTNLSEVLEIAQKFEIAGLDYIKLSKFPSWKEEGLVTLTNVEEGAVYSFSFVTKDMDKNNWFIVVDSINEESETAVIFLKEDENVDANILSLNEAVEFDLDKDNVNDLKITLIRISDGKIDFMIEKTEDFIRKETKYDSKQRKIIFWIIMISIVIGIVLISLIIYFHVQKKKIIRNYYHKK